MNSRSATDASTRAVEAMRARFNAILEAIPHGVVFTNLDSRTGWLNSTAAEWLRISRETMDAPSIWTAIERLRASATNQDELATDTAPIQTDSETPETSIWTINHEQTSALEVYSLPIHTPAVRGRLWLFTDISARLQVAAAYRESEDSFRRLIEASYDGIAIIVQGVMLYSNQALADMFGYSREEMIGMSPFELAPPETHEIIMEKLRTNDENPYELTALRKDGALIHIELRGRSIRYFGNLARVTSVRDITEQKRVEAETQKRLEQLAILRRVSNDLSATLDINYVIEIALDFVVRLNSAAFASVALVEHDRMNVIHSIGKAQPEIAAEYAARLDTRLSYLIDIGYKAGRTYIFIPLIVSDQTIGALFVEENPLQPLSQETIDLTALIASRIAVAIENARLYDLSQRRLAELQKAHEQLAYQAEHDPLTGLANRALFEKRMNEVITANKPQASLLYIDLDRFKQVNDTLGHEAGDGLLCMVSDRMKNCIGDAGVLARLGGDEFALLLPFPANQHDALTVASCIIEALSKPFIIQNTVIVVTSSIGISFFPQHGETVPLLVRRADTAMYQAKLAGKNTYRIYSHEDEDDPMTQLRLENDLRGAIERGELVLYYQPQLQLQSNHITGLEALVRWQHPQLGLLSPAQFIPLAEERGLIVSIGSWVLEEACRQCRHWHELGYRVAVAVNVSAAQFEQPNFIETVQRTLEQCQLPAPYLELEITESLLVKDFAKTNKQLQALRALGVSLAIDDFGTGYSSLNYLRQLPVSILKIDRSFIADINDDAAHTGRATAIIQAISTMAHSLGMTTIAEGVETETQERALRAAECDGLQGYLMSKPRPAAEIEALLAQYAQNDDA